MARWSAFLRRTHLAALAVAAALTGVTACAAKAGPGAEAGGAADAGSGSDCGTVTYRAPGGNADLSQLPKDIREGYNGYFAPVDTSVYKGFKADASGPLKIGYSDSFSANGWRGDALARLKQDATALRKSGVVSSLQTANSNLDNSLQIQQITSMINQRVDAIIAIPNSPTAFNNVIKQAYDAGIPFITLNSHVTSPYAINVDTNYHLTGELVGAGLAKKVKGKGDVLIVDGIAGSPASTTLHEGYQAAFDKCPGIKVTGSLEGQWSEATAKSVVLQHLSTHPGQLAAVVNSGGMTNGILQALEQTGRKPVPIGDANPDQGSLVSLRKLLSDQYVAGVTPAAQGMDAALLTAIAVLRGQGPKVDAIVATPSQITGRAALDSWIRDGWTASSAAQAPAPPGVDWLSPQQLRSYFERPGQLPELPPLP
ncbi:substrate-binding domain-containing protein [Streptomyces sp. NPDC006617]|uniref:substrate-binding domain-containing protein n=1 Tax=Streptomyces sp. NPDC006617 TaxID=3155354 RepID=UPI0033BE5C29